VRRLAILAMPHPLRVRHQIGVDPRGQGVASGYLFAFQIPWRPERKLVADDASYVATLLRAWGGPGYPDAESERRYRQAMRIPGVAHSSLEYHRWVFRSLFRPDGARFAGALRLSVPVPTLHLHGRLDRCVLPATAQGSGRYVSGPYQWKLIAGVGHFLHEEAPDTVNAELLGWLTAPSQIPDGSPTDP
jgi:pimeloyl-ACP methyl ester carboxylesterase